ncbi:TetR/AcrR family transcriptional regulator [Kineococcus glutinatus]|uniref:TetR/AcrR family transcriptional regulator n=1 Tax=Kineococcus glutinatus TaxID=1070872 RepID=A0ABP9I4V0_9ACTN
MSSEGRRAPTGHATLQPRVSDALARATLEELAVTGYARLTVEGVARRARVGKAAVYRRWPSKQQMTMAALSQLVVPIADVPDSGSLREDVRASLRALHDWLVDPVYGAVVPDLTSAAAHDAGLAEALWREVGQPRRELASAVLARAVRRGELPGDLDVEMALDVIAGPLYWRLAVRRVPVDDSYLDDLSAWLLRALGASEV